MIKGAIIFTIAIESIEAYQAEQASSPITDEVSNTSPNWTMIQSYFTESQSKPEDPAINTLIKRLHSEKYPKHLNLRFFEEKYAFYQINPEDSPEKVYLLYILTQTQTLEILSLDPIVSYEELFERVKKRTKVNEILQDLVNSKNIILEKLYNPEILQKQVGNRANEFIDQGKYTEAQELMKIAKEIPKKFTDAMKAARTAIHNNKFRQADKNLLTAYNLAGKLEDTIMESYLKLRIVHIQKIPEFHKQIKKTVKQIHSQFSTFPFYLNYLENIDLMHEAIDLYENLEQDEHIAHIQDLSELLIQADEIARNLSQKDQEIREILKKISNNSH